MPRITNPDAFVLPASAGMIPSPNTPMTKPMGAPRIRGDDPALGI